MCLSTNPHGKGDTCEGTVPLCLEEGESSKAMRAWVKELGSRVSSIHCEMHSSYCVHPYRTSAP